MKYEEALARFGLNPDIRLRQMFELGKLAAQPAQHQCKFPMCHNEEYQQALAEQIKREIYTGETAQRKPLTPDQKQALAENWFAEDWAITKAIGMMIDHEQLLGIKENT